jgi:hypothetical protein
MLTDIMFCGPYDELVDDMTLLRLADDWWLTDRLRVWKQLLVEPHDVVLPEMSLGRVMMEWWCTGERGTLLPLLPRADRGEHTHPGFDTGLVSGGGAPWVGVVQLRFFDDELVVWYLCRLESLECRSFFLLKRLWNLNLSLNGLRFFSCFESVLCRCRRRLRAEDADEAGGGSERIDSTSDDATELRPSDWSMSVKRSVDSERTLSGFDHGMPRLRASVITSSQLMCVGSAVLVTMASSESEDSDPFTRLPTVSRINVPSFSSL